MLKHKSRVSTQIVPTAPGKLYGSATLMNNLENRIAATTDFCMSFEIISGFINQSKRVQSLRKSASFKENPRKIKKIRDWLNSQSLHNRVVTKIFVFVISRKFRKILISCFAKFSSSFAKFSRNTKSKFGRNFRDFAKHQPIFIKV